MSTLEEVADQQRPEDEEIDQEILSSTTDDINSRTRLLDNDIKVMRSEMQRLSHDKQVMLEKVKDNKDKIDNNKQLPYLVGNIVELLDVEAEEDAEKQGANIDLDSTRVGKSAVVKTSTRQTIFYLW